jgi:hypothetical protein
MRGTPIFPLLSNLGQDGVGDVEIPHPQEISQNNPYSVSFLLRQKLSFKDLLPNKIIKAKDKIRNNIYILM